MPISILQNYNYVNDLLSKNNGVYISPKEYERYGYISSLEMFDDFMGIKTIPKITIGKNRLIDTRLLPFKKKVTTTFTGETLLKPSDCKYISAMYEVSSKIPVRPLDDDRRAKIFQDPLASPTTDDKYYVENFSDLTLLGTENLQVVLEYYERPKPIVYGYTVVNGRPVFDQATSVDYQWDISEQEELTNRILVKAGLSMSSPLTLQVANNNKAQE